MQKVKSDSTSNLWKGTASKPVLERFKQQLEQFQQQHEPQQISYSHFPITQSRKSQSPFIKWDQEIAKQSPAEIRPNFKVRVKGKSVGLENPGINKQETSTTSILPSHCY